MKRSKYHFFRYTQTTCGKSLLSLPGQTFGQVSVPAGVLVKDARGSTAVARAKRTASVGEIFFSTSVRRLSGCLVASDMHSLDRNTDILLSDAEEEYAKITTSAENQK